MEMQEINSEIALSALVYGETKSILALKCD